MTIYRAKSCSSFNELLVEPSRPLGMSLSCREAAAVPSHAADPHDVARPQPTMDIFSLFWSDVGVSMVCFHLFPLALLFGGLFKLIPGRDMEANRGGEGVSPATVFNTQTYDKSFIRLGVAKIYGVSCWTSKIPHMRWAGLGLTLYTRGREKLGLPISIV